MSARRKCPTHKKDCHTHGSAIRAAIAYSRKRGTPLRPYWHKDCGAWHLSHKPRLGFDTHTGTGFVA